LASTAGVEASLASKACASAGDAHATMSAAAAVKTSVLARRRECSNAISTTRRYPADPWQGHDFTPLGLLSGYAGTDTTLPISGGKGVRLLERQGDDTRSGTATLLRRYHQDSDTGARQRLIELYLPLVESFARRYSRSSSDYDDLYQVGCIGLINAIDRFDLERGEELTAFAVPNITGEIRRYLRDRGPTVKLPRRVVELRAAVARAQPELTARLGRVPSNAELAREVGAAQDDVALAIEAGRASVALELPPESGGEDDRGEGSLDAAEDRLFLSDAFRGLDERERRVLFLRHVQDLEPNEIAGELGISRRQVSRVTQDALMKLRTGLERSVPDAGDAPAPASRRRQPTAVAKRQERDYGIELVRDVAGGRWVAQVRELPGCIAVGETAEEAVRQIQSAVREWPADAVGKAPEAPKTRSASKHGGRVLVRMPPPLHAELARAADRKQVSLNQFITDSLSAAVRRRRGEEPAGGAEAAPQKTGRSTALLANLVALAGIAALAVVLLVVAVSRL
jgi:RNA polymerase sigma-B factor